MLLAHFLPFRFLVHSCVSTYPGDDILVAEVEEVLRDTDLMQRTVDADPRTDVSDEKF